jgi:hypothetical protein
MANNTHFMYLGIAATKQISPNYTKINSMRNGKQQHARAVVQQRHEFQRLFTHQFIGILSMIRQH